MNNFYGHLHSRDAMQQHQALAAAAGRRSRRGRHRHRRRRASASPTRAYGGIWICPTPSPACPIRSAPRSSSTRRSGTARPAATTCSRPIRWWRRPAARCTAPTRSRNWPKRSGCRRSGCSDVVGEYNTAHRRRLAAKARRRRGAATAPRRGRSGRRRSMPCRSARRSPTPWAASWWTATPACSTPTTSRSRASYAAGSTVGGLDGGPHAGYVGGLIKATIGLLAAETIAGKS